MRKIGFSSFISSNNKLSIENELVIESVEEIATYPIFGLPILIEDSIHFSTRKAVKI